MDALQPLLDLLGEHKALVLTVLAWVGALRLALKPINAGIQSLASKAVVFVLSSPEPDDDQLLLKIVGSIPYRIVAFLFDMLASVKLPSTSTIKEKLN